MLGGTEWVTLVSVVVLVAAFGVTLSTWTRQVRPSFGARLLIAASVLVAGAVLVTATLLALPLAGQSDALADRGHWSEAAFSPGSRSARAVALLAALLVAFMVLRGARELYDQRRARVAAVRFRNGVGAGLGEVVIAASEDADAMALASGVIVVTSGLVRALDAEQRRAVLAHERAHLTFRHHRYLRVGGFVAAMNPFLFRVPDALIQLTERWADEEAARVTSRATTAAALEAVAMLSAEVKPRRVGVFHAAVAAAELRLRALRSHPSTSPSPRLLLPVGLVFSLVALAAMVCEHTLDLIQLARI
jgi:Zn-dependent protease with chaperone function